MVLLRRKIRGYLCETDPKQSRKAAGLELGGKPSAATARVGVPRGEFLGARVMRRCSLDGKKGCWLELEGWIVLGRMSMGHGPMIKSS